MRKIAFVNQKGGCGKTTTAINVASFLAAMRRKVLLIDLDPQGHVALGFGITPDHIEQSIYEVLLGEIQIKRAIRTVRNNLDAVLSDVLLSAFEQVMAGGPERELKLKRSLEFVEDSYEYLIIDNPPSVGLLTYNGLIASEEVIIPVDPSFFSIQGLNMLLETLHMIEQETKHKLSIKILATNVDIRTNFCRYVVQTLRSRFPNNCFETYINTCTLIREATRYGKPIIEYDRHCAAYRDYLSLAKEILGEEPRVTAREFSFIESDRLNLAQIITQTSKVQRPLWREVWDLLERQK